MHSKYLDHKTIKSSVFKNSRYTNLDNELQELSKKEKAEYGLSEQLKIKKENIQTKLNELGNQLEILEDNLRFAIFNEERVKSNMFFSY